MKSAPTKTRTTGRPRPAKPRPRPPTGRRRGPAPGEERAKVDLTIFLKVIAVSCLFSTGIIHGLWTALHFDEWLGAGLFFFGLAVTQTLGAFALVAIPGRLVYFGIVANNIGTVFVWAVSRTIGMPVGPTAGQPASVGAPDLIATFLELLSVVALLTLLLQPAPAGRKTTRMPPRAYIVLATIPFYTLLLTCVAVVPAAAGHGTHPGHAQHNHSDHSHG